MDTFPEAAGRACVVTGANQGIGYEIARALAASGARVTMIARDAERGERAARALRDETGSEGVELLVGDLGRPGEVRRLAAALAGRHEHLDALVNNAGVVLDLREETPDGIERTWAVNVLAYHLLAALCLPLLRRSRAGRIVNVASMYAGGLDLDDVEFRRRCFRGLDAYAQSKQANRMLTWALARRLDKSSVTANAMHPGAVATQLLRKGFGSMGGRTPEQGADTAAWLAASDEAAGKSGRFFVDRAERSCQFHDEAQEERLAALCDRMTGLAD